MSSVSVFFDYLAWHYSAGIKEFLRIWGNMHWFWYHFFSVPVLLSTLVKPYRRMREGYGRGFNPGKMFESLIVNVMMRIVGLVIRSAFLALGLVAQLFTLVLGGLFFLLYLLSPIAVPAGIFMGFLFVVG